MQEPYSESIRAQMKAFFETLSERERRHYAAIEAMKLPYGGISYIAKLFTIAISTIRIGIKELETETTLPSNRDRRPGGGSKTAFEKYPMIDQVFLELLKNHTAGDPMNDSLKWTHLTLAQISAGLQARGIDVKRYVVKKLLKKHGFAKRKALKKKAAGSAKDRNAQFERIQALRQDYQQQGLPVISVDTKKKELLGDLFRAGHLYTRETLEVSDHDFPSLATGVAIPHGIYDVARNQAHITIGASHDTSEFACDSIRHWWLHHGHKQYPGARKILMLMDGGGSNSSRHYLFKQDLQALADELGIAIRVAHYPPYTSKWNPIEHRVFPHITRALQGVILKTHAMTKQLIEKTSTKTGLSVTASIIDKVYQTGRKVMEGFKENMRIVFDALLPAWNHVAHPYNAFC